MFAEGKTDLHILNLTVTKCCIHRVNEQIRQTDGSYSMVRWLGHSVATDKKMNSVKKWLKWPNTDVPSQLCRCNSCYQPCSLPWGVQTGTAASEWRCAILISISMIIIIGNSFGFKLTQVCKDWWKRLLRRYNQTVTIGPTLWYLYTGLNGWLKGAYPPFYSI